jgi:hypothetical protein
LAPQPQTLYMPIEVTVILALLGLALSPLAAFAIAARVFDIRAYRRWQSGARTRLGARLLRAYSDGRTWGAWLRQRRVHAL